MNEKKYSINFTTADNQTITFYYQKNSLNGNYMYWLDNHVSMYATTKKDINSMIKYIKKYHKINEIKEV